MLKSKKGFTLIEVIVVAAIIAILAGVLVPLIFKEIDEARISRASADIRSISSALIILKKDTGQWPVMDGACAQAATILKGAGTDPTGLAGMGFDSTSAMAFDEALSTNSLGCYANWKGAYIAIVSADPWGHAYVVNAKDFGSGAPVWILSAGPNGAVETAVNATVAGGDDIGLRLR